MAEVQQANEPAPGSRDVKVVNFIAAKRKQEAMRQLHPLAREYVYRPGTFEPLALIDKQAQLQPTAAQGQAPMSVQPKPMAPTAPVASQPLAIKPPTAAASSGLGGLGAGAGLGVQKAAPTAEPTPTANQSSEAPPLTTNGLGLGAAGLGAGLSLVLSAPPARAEVQPTAPAAPPKQAQAQQHQTQPAVNGEVFYYFNDPNGCPTRLATSTGAVVWSASYSAWGQVAQLHVNLVKQPIRLQGQQEDGETGLHFNRQRYYDPPSASFASTDPLGQQAGENTYNYGPSAQRWIDPLGLTCQRLSGSTVVDRVAGEIDAAVGRADRMLSRGMSGGTPWGRIYQGLMRRDPNHWLLPIARGNAVHPTSTHPTLKSLHPAN
jgi:RHS repeat-associated protein